MSSGPSDPSEAGARSLIGKTVLGRYRILRHLADGGMGAIYLARNEGAAGFIRPVVVKVLLPGLVEDERMVDMFMREARIMATLRHPSIVSVLDFSRDGDMHVMVLDYVHGFHLGRWHKYVTQTRGPFPVAIGLQVMLQVLRALHYAHTLKGPDGAPLNIVHRDVTPSNILIDVEGHTKLADFGIARMNTERTEAGKHAIKGKFPYLAPELLDGADPTPQSDVYAAGVTFHQLLIGRNEFGGNNIPAIVSRILKHDATWLADIRDDVSPELADAIKRALAKDPAERFESAAQFAEAIAWTRRMTEDEAARKLAEAAGADFRDPRMAAALSLPQLNELESSWTTPSPGAGQSLTDSGVSQPGPRKRADPADTDPNAAEMIYGDDGYASAAEATVAMKPTPTPVSFAAPPRAAPAPAPRALPPRKIPWAMALMGVAVLGIGAVAVVALLRSADRAPAEEPPPYVVVDRTAAADAAPVAVAAVDAAAIATPAPDARPPRDDRKPEPAKGGGTAKELTRAFLREKGKIEGCFDRHAVDVTGAPELSVRFRVDRDGSVTEAELVPASLAATGLGACILGVARATRFGRLDEPVTFRVPLRARVK